MERQFAAALMVQWEIQATYAVSYSSNVKNMIYDASLLYSQGAYLAIIIKSFFVFAAEHGDWTPWTEWTPCSKTCQDLLAGVKQRNRSCSNPSPSNGGADCPGYATEKLTCNRGVSCGKYFHLLF